MLSGKFKKIDFEVGTSRNRRSFSTQLSSLNMQLFRKLAGNIFFKIILAFVALSFVLFGISGFILGSPNAWVAKVGGTSIGHNSFNNALRSDREIILASNKSEEALRYADSEKFKSEVLGRLVNKVMIEKLTEDFGTFASKKIILEAIAKDPNFKNETGKFDREKFKNFLSQNGFNEERYVNEISSEVTATMILQSMSLVAPLNYGEILAKENFKQEKRLADVIKVSEKNVSNIANPTAAELQEFFAENKAEYTLPEMRKVSYFTFLAQDFAKDLQISENEIRAEYEKNKEQFKNPETRNFYHVLFEKDEEAKAFLEKFNQAVKSDKSSSKEYFSKLAKELAKKDLKAITLSKISQKDLIPQLAEPIFKLLPNQTSEVLQSPLGFHVFLLLEIKESQPLSYAEVKKALTQKLSEGRKEKVLQEKLSAIDDALLTTNSLQEVAKKFNLKLFTAVKINQSGQNEKGQQVTEIKDLSQFTENAFAAKKGQASKIFQSVLSGKFYALKVEEIFAAHDRDLSEVKDLVTQNLLKKKRHEALLNLIKKIGEEVNSSPNSAAQIAAKYRVTFEKNREFSRISYISFQGREIPYQSKFSQNLFASKIGEATRFEKEGEEEYALGILREIKKSAANPAQFEQAKKRAGEDLRNFIMQEYNTYLLKKYPVKVNEKFFGKEEEK